MIRPRSMEEVVFSEAVALEQERLVARTLAALEHTPAAIALGQGLDPATVALLLAGGGDRDEARRLARALERESEELLTLARELTAAAQEQN